jgi:hypothetical protein
MVLAPITKGIAAEAEPEATAVPFTKIEAVPSPAVGVTVIDETV